jgi:hypothetical protein
MKKLIFLLILLVPALSQAALSKKETTEALAWTELAAASGTTGIKETGSIDVSLSYATTLHIDVCLSSTTAHEGTEVIVQVSSEAGVDGSWSTLTTLHSTPATAVDADFGAGEAAGQTTLTITNPETENVDNSGKFIFIENTGTPTESEIQYVIASGNDAQDTIEILDGLDHAQTTDSDVWDVDSATVSAVSTWAVSIPFSASQARVIFNNWYDQDGTASTVYVRARTTEATGL